MADIINVGDEMFYIGKFKRYKVVRVLAIKDESKLDCYGFVFKWKEYLIEFQNGKRKLVKRDKLF